MEANDLISMQKTVDSAQIEQENAPSAIKELPSLQSIGVILNLTGTTTKKKATDSATTHKLDATVVSNHESRAINSSNVALYQDRPLPTNIGDFWNPGLPTQDYIVKFIRQQHENPQQRLIHVEEAAVVNTNQPSAKTLLNGYRRSQY